MRFYSAIVGGLALGLASCALEPHADEPDGPEPVGEVVSAITVNDALSGCSTGSVAGLSKQIIAEMNCITPNALVAVPARPNLVQSYSYVFMYLQPPAANALVKALDANTGKTLHVSSMLRTLPQQWLLYHWYTAGKCGIPLAATPGNSNHEGGTAFDTSDYSSWKSALAAHSFAWYGSSDVYHFTYNGGGSVDLKGTDVLAFQKLWNLNHPNDTISEDGSFGPETDARIGKAPADGFAQGPTCGSSSDAGSGGSGGTSGSAGSGGGALGGAAGAGGGAGASDAGASGGTGGAAGSAGSNSGGSAGSAGAPSGGSGGGAGAKTKLLDDGQNSGSCTTSPSRGSSGLAVAFTLLGLALCTRRRALEKTRCRNDHYFR